MSHDVDETYGFYNEREVQARRPHFCCAYGETIARGHKHWVIAFEWDYEVTAIRRCLRCQEMHVALRNRGGHGTWPDENLDCGEEYEEHWDEPPPEELARLAFMTPAEMQKRNDPK